METAKSDLAEDVIILSGYIRNYLYNQTKPKVKKENLETYRRGVKLKEIKGLNKLYFTLPIDMLSLTCEEVFKN